jgi:hypothetical protein
MTGRRSLFDGHSLPFIGAQRFACKVIPRRQTSARSLTTNSVRLELKFSLPTKPMPDLPPRLTIGSNRSLRSLGRAKARPLTKR